MLKIIALITMLIDHTGLFWGIKSFRLIGRLSFPIYSFLIANGIKKTKNIKKYMSRILILAVISQFVWLYTGTTTLNILFSYFLFIVIIYFIEHKKNIIASIIFLIMVIVSPILDYGFYGFVLLAIMYYVENKYITLILMFTSITYFVNSDLLSIYSYISILSVFLIDKYDKPKYYKRYKKYKKLFYWIYPLHIFILFEIYKIFH